MPDITVRGWRCDICGKTFYENSAFFNDYYRISIEPGNADASDREDIYFGYVCQDCKIDVCEYVQTAP